MPKKKLFKSDPSVRQSYLENEVLANREMTKLTTFMAAALTIMLIGYIFKLFPLSDYTLIYIFFPIDILILLTPLMWSRTKMVYRPKYKYFLMFTVLIVIAVINVLVPKHGVMGWALTIVVTNHYYSRKLTTRVFIGTIIAMLVCLYMGMFFGEYDNNLIGTGWVGNGTVVEPFSVQDRLDYLHSELISGNNRYLKVLLFYYNPRAVFITMIYLSCLSLDNRTYNLLKKEIALKTEKEKIDTELGVANDIQLSALPKEFINDEDVSVFGSMHTAKEVGGDFYNYVVRGDDIFFIIGDVSGKGIPAALFMMKANAYFETSAVIFSSPKDIAFHMNDGLLKGNESMMFLTGFIGKFNKKSGVITFCNCGHNPPVIEDKNGEFHYLKSNRGFLLGTLENPPLMDEEVHLDPDCHFVLYTDGITECKNEHDEFFGEAAFLQKLSSYQKEGPKELCESIYRTLMIYKGTAEQSDDITIFSFKRSKRPEGVFPKEPGAIKGVLAFVKGKLSEANVPSKVGNSINVAVDEIVSNIINYSVATKIKLSIDVQKEEPAVCLTIEDDGDEFNPLESEDPDITLEADEREIGGLGIFLVKKMMDSLTYERVGNNNRVTIVKKF